MIPENLLPEGAEWYVAGGWAACPTLADDQDVWVYVKTPPDEPEEALRIIEEAREVILIHLKKTLLSDDIDIDIQDDMRTMLAYRNELAIIRKVAIVRWAFDRKPIHVLVTNATANDLINTFDITTHQIAITRIGEIIKGQHWTPVTVPPVKIFDTPTTLERMKKLQSASGTHSRLRLTIRLAVDSIMVLDDDDTPF